MMTGSFVTKEVEEPRRLRVFDALSEDWLATFTWGARTVRLSGPARIFSETFEASGNQKTVTVQHSTWVRTAPGPFTPPLDERWLRLALAANYNGVADVLELATQYFKGAPARTLAGVTIAGGAHYGKLLPNGDREEGSDFNDYLGLRWDYPNEPPDLPEPDQFGCLDCSGFIRMIWGFRGTLPNTPYNDRVPMSLEGQKGTTLPRRAVQMCAEGPGIFVIANGGVAVATPVARARLRIGDLVFFDRDKGDGSDTDHVGMYVGRDQDDRLRFVSSRKRHNGPTMGDEGGASLLEGPGDYAKAFLAARRQ
jgi:cell wall-associated NlpC family hydrolase